MRQEHIKAILEGLIPVVKEAIAAEQKPLIQRLDALERRAPEKGEPGVPGADGKDGASVSMDDVAPVLAAFRENPAAWVDFMMRFELGLDEPDPKRASRSALTIALSYIAGGLVPLSPYFIFRSVSTALIGSVVVTLLALFVFGYIKGRFTTARPLRSAWQTVVVGGLAAAAAFGIAKAIG